MNHNAKLYTLLITKLKHTARNMCIKRLAYSHTGTFYGTFYDIGIIGLHLESRVESADTVDIVVTTQHTGFYCV